MSDEKLTDEERVRLMKVVMWSKLPPIDKLMAMAAILR